MVFGIKHKQTKIEKERQTQLTIIYQQRGYFTNGELREWRCVTHYWDVTPEEDFLNKISTRKVLRG